MNANSQGWISLAHHRGSLNLSENDIETIENAILSVADLRATEYRNSACAVPMGASPTDFVRGSNGEASTQALVLLRAYEISNNTEYLDAAQANLDYLLGRNPTCYSYVTGFGDKTPMNIHHRQSDADGIADPVPGFVAGGPNPDQQDANY